MEVDIFLTIIAPLAGIVILLILSAFFSGSETALTAASKVRLTAQEKGGNKKAALVNQIREKKDRMIGALLLGNNMVNILASALATSVLIKMFGEAGVVYATLVMTILVLIFSEVLPKTYALHHADSMSMRIAPIIRIVIIVFAPITEAVTWIVRLLLKTIGANNSKVGVGSHLELLRGAIELHKGQDKETQDQRAMLRSILDLVDVDIEEIMIHRQNVTMIDVSDSPSHIVEKVLNSPYTRIPLWKDNPDNIVGVVHAKWLLRALRKRDGDPTGLDITKVALDPWFVPETTTLYDQLQAFRERKEHFALVIDEYGGFQGIVTLEDILEEIVGEITDEHDVQVQGVHWVAPNTYSVHGTVTIRDLNRELGWNLPDTNYSTLAGLIIHESQSVPEAGQHFSFHGFYFEILKRNKNQITKLRVKALGKAD